MYLTDFLIAVVLVFILYLVISFIWQALEQAMYGKNTKRSLDDLVAIILAWSIYANIM